MKDFDKRGVAPQATARQVLLLLADGTRPDLMEQLLARGELPGIARTLLEPGRATAGDAPAPDRRLMRACSVFPSTTGPAHLPFLTGCFPGPCNVPGIRWLDPQVYATRFWSPFRFRSYMGPGNFLAARDLSPRVRTLFELVRDHASIAGNVRRGVRFGRDLTRWAKLLQNARSFFAEEWYGMDRVAGDKLLQAAARGTRFVFASFYAADSNGHKHGPDHPRTLEAYRRIDASVGRLGELLRREGREAETLIVLVSDHGLTATTQHLDLQRLVERVAGRCLAHPTLHHGLFAAQAAVMVSGNSMAHVYLRGQGSWAGDDLLLDRPGPVLQRLVDALLAEEAVDVIAGRAAGGGVLALSRRGRALVTPAADGGGVAYRSDGGDPFGYPPELAGTYPDRELLRRTWDSDYPDAPAQLLQLFGSPRCGHLVISATLGHDLRARFEKPAHHGSHGSLHRLHLHTPLLLNRPVTAPGPWRTVDVFPTLLGALGLPLPARLDGISLFD